MRKDLIGLGSAMFVWFVVLVVVQLSPSVDVETFVLAFWSVPVFSIISLILGVVPEKKSSGTESNRPKSAT